jgi:hypothetical protein
MVDSGNFGGPCDNLVRNTKVNLRSPNSLMTFSCGVFGFASVFNLMGEKIPRLASFSDGRITF